MKQVFIVQTEAVTPLADNLGDLWLRLLEGCSSIKPIQRFPIANYSSGVASCMEDLADQSPNSACHLLIDRVVQQMKPIPKDAFLIVATTKGGIDNLEKVSRQEPAHLYDAFLFSLGEALSNRLGLNGHPMTVSAACASSSVAAAQGEALISMGYKEVVLVCCIDLVTEFVFSGFSSLKILSPTPCRPFDRNRNGLSLGEGAAALLLMSEERCRRDRRIPLGRICGWGICNDAVHITSPAQDGSGLVRAITQALDKAHIASDDLAGVSAHGTGTVYNDSMELNAFSQVFKGRKIPAYSIKGALGHTMGAAGGIEIAVALHALTSQRIPPTIRCTSPEDMAEGMIGPVSRSVTGPFLLTTNSGFGGINAALILGRESG